MQNIEKGPFFSLRSHQERRLRCGDEFNHKLIPTGKDVWLEGGQSRKQVEDGHLDQRVFTGPVLQHPPTHLEKARGKRDAARISTGECTGLDNDSNICSLACRLPKEGGGHV